MIEKKAKKVKKISHKAYLVTSVILVLAVVLCLIFSIQVMTKGYVSIGGKSMFRVITGSMEPTISKGAVLVCQEMDIEDIKKNDIVCYRTRVAEIEGYIVTHRVMSVQKDENGIIYLETRGDANLSSDPYFVDYTSLIGKVTWFSGEESILTDMLSFISGRIGFLALIVIPVLVIGGIIMQTTVKNLQRDIAMARLELERSKLEKDAALPDDSELLPGYTTLTYADYEAIYQSLKQQLLEEINERNKGQAE